MNKIQAQGFRRRERRPSRAEPAAADAHGREVGGPAWDSGLAPAARYRGRFSVASGSPAKNHSPGAAPHTKHIPSRSRRPPALPREGVGFPVEDGLVNAIYCPRRLLM